MVISLTIDINTDTFYSCSRLCIENIVFVLFFNFRIV